MGDLALVFSAVVDIFKIEFTIYGFTLNFWQIFLFSGFAGIVAWLLGQFFSGG